MQGAEKAQLLRVFSAVSETSGDVAAQDFFQSVSGRAYREPLVRFVTSVLQTKYENAAEIAEKLVESMQTFRDIEVLIHAPIKLAERLQHGSDTDTESYKFAEGSVAETSGAVVRELQTQWAKGKKAVSELFSARSDFEAKQDLAYEVDMFINHVKAARARLPHMSSVSERRDAYLNDADGLLEILFSQHVPQGAGILFGKTTPHQDMRSYVQNFKDVIVSAVKELLLAHNLEHVYDHEMTEMLEGAGSRAYLRSYLRGSVVIRGFHSQSTIGSCSTGTDQPKLLSRKQNMQAAATTAPEGHQLVHAGQPDSEVVQPYTVVKSKSFNALCAFLFINLFVLLLLIPLSHEYFLQEKTRRIIVILAEVCVAASIFTLGCWLIFSGNCHEIRLLNNAEHAPCGHLPDNQRVAQNTSVTEVAHSPSIPSQARA
ncbi:hypothetical protein OC188_00930 [Anaplasma capra]|uniref:hypothetical protein n=1 Tax=Anaplasma capra TaxID=1562740 RepID=UPI0021D600D7|nr:hypothetical protein [Anaplasma capra]MCU7611269.1 hypothetical protein [Anaplasma capra]